jgi:hypothetical protein
MTAAEFQAIKARALVSMMAAADLGLADTFTWWRGYLKGVLDTMSDYAALMAQKDAELAYEPPAYLKAAWAALPEGAENFTMAEMHEFLAAQGVELAEHLVANSKVNPGEQLEHSELASAANVHDEHASAGVDLNNCSLSHSTLPVAKNNMVAKAQGGAA